jgi:hypothetical protein
MIAVIVLALIPVILALLGIGYLAVRRVNIEVAEKQQKLDQQAAIHAIKVAQEWSRLEKGEPEPAPSKELEATKRVNSHEVVCRCSQCQTLDDFERAGYTINERAQMVRHRTIR